MKKQLMVFGAGDLGREILYAAQDCCPFFCPDGFEFVGFIDEDPEKIGAPFEGYPVLSLEEAQRGHHPNTWYMVGVGVSSLRRTLVEKLRAVIVDPSFAVVVHRSVVAMPKVEIEPGSYVAAHATLATATHLGAHGVVNQNVSVGHDCSIGRYSVISPGCVLSGRTEIGEGTFLGSNAVTYPGVRIGADCTVSALAVVSRHLASGAKLIAKPNTMLLKA